MASRVEEIGAKMDALGLWEALAPYNFAVRPRGTVFPYFCTVVKGEREPVRFRFLMLEGWQTLHDFVRTRVDVNFGVYTTPMELPHYELIVLEGGETKAFRGDPGYAPRELRENERAIVEKLLWESYGIMLRVEADSQLPMRFADEQAIFSRLESADGKWSDEPFPIQQPVPYTEQIAFPKARVKIATDLPFDAKWKLSLDFAMVTGLMTREARPRCVYSLRAVDSASRAKVFDQRVSVAGPNGLKALWEGMPAQLMEEFIRLGKVPGELRLRSGRVFRFLRPLSVELPIRLSLHDRLEELEG